MEFSLSRSKITLREANAAYRELRRNAKALMHRAETFLITAIVLYKILTNLFFLPAMRGIWSLTLRFSPVNYLTNNNAHQIFTAPSILGGIALIAVLAALWNLYEFSLVLHGLDFARRGEACKLRPLFRESFAAIRHAVFPKNWPILFYCAVLIPFTDVFVTSNYITQLAVPEYIMGVIRAKPIYLALYSAIFLAAVLLTVFFALVLPLFALEHKNFGTAVKESCAYVKQRFFRILAALARWNFGVLLRMGLLFVLATMLMYGIVAVVGLESTRAMLLLSRALQLVELPFFGFLLDCKVTVAQCTILGLLYFRTRSAGAFAPEERPDGKRSRPRGRLLLTAMVAGVTLVTCGVTAYLLSLPQDDALLAAVGGVTPLVTYHRGDCSIAPENTMPAFRSAILKKGDRIELDVQMTKDGVAVVTHDTNLRRCTGKNAKVYDLTFAEIEQLDAGSWFSTRFAGTRIPSFEEVLQLCQGKIDLNVEIKPSAAIPTLEAETVRLLREYGFEGHCVITSQSYETLHKVKELAPDIPTGYILALGVGNYYDLPDADFFSVETTFITSGMVNQIHLRGKTVSAWTIDREEDAKHMMELGADDLITDKPDMVNELLSQNAEMDTTLLSLRDAIQNWFFPSDEEVSDSVEEVIEDVIEDPEEFLDAA